MENKKLGQESAFPLMDNEFREIQWGMDKRFYAACAAMQGLLLAQNNDIDVKWTALTAFYCTDELLKRENESL